MSIRVDFGSHTSKKDDTQRKDTLSVLRDARKAEKEGDLPNAGKLYERVMLRLGPAISDEMRMNCLEGMLRTGRRNVPYILEYIDMNRTALEPSMRKVFLSVFSYLDDEIRRARKEERPDDMDALLDDAILTVKKMLLIMGRTTIPQETIRNLFRLRYRESPRLRECVLRYFIEEKNLLSKIRGFERDIALRPGAFVLDVTEDKVGRITDMTGSIFSVSFGSRERGRSVCLDEAVKILVPLSKKDLRVIRKAVPADKIYRRMLSDRAWIAEALVYTLTAPDRKKAWCTLEDMHAEMVPGMVSEAVWRQLRREIKDECEVDPNIRVMKGKGTAYGMSPYPESMDDKKSREFALSGYFDEKVRFALDFLALPGASDFEDTLYLMKEHFLKTFTMGTLSEKLTSAVIVDMITGKGDWRKTRIFSESLSLEDKTEAIRGVKEARIRASVMEIV